MVPPMEMEMIVRKLDTNVTSMTAVLALTALMMQLALRTSMASEDSVASMAPMAPTALMVLASVALLASMVLGDSSKKRRELSNEMLRYSPLQTWLCFSSNRPGKLVDAEVRDGLTLSK